MVNRVKTVSKKAGGKGLNISRVLEISTCDEWIECNGGKNGVHRSQKKHSIIEQIQVEKI